MGKNFRPRSRSENFAVCSVATLGSEIFAHLNGEHKIKSGKNSDVQNRLVTKESAWNIKQENGVRVFIVVKNKYTSEIFPTKKMRREPTIEKL